MARLAAVQRDTLLCTYANTRSLYVTIVRRTIPCTVLDPCFCNISSFGKVRAEMRGRNFSTVHRPCTVDDFDSLDMRMYNLISRFHSRYLRRNRTICCGSAQP